MTLFRDAALFAFLLLVFSPAIYFAFEVWRCGALQ